MSKNFLNLGLVMLGVFILSGNANAMMRSTADSDSYSDSGYGGHSNISADLQMDYVRDTAPNAGSDSAARLNLGGMFNSWAGVDAVGMYEVKSANYLVGGDLRLMPTSWLFFKAGVGAYSDKDSGLFRGTPLIGTGIMAPIYRNYYILSEFSYFQFEQANNVSFGVGFGVKF